MQDKEGVDDAEEALTATKAEATSDQKGDQGRRESNKDNKFAFRKMKTPKKEKPDKNSPSKYEGEGVVFKAKLIGVESVTDPRGDKMCQEAMQRLKLNVKSSGPHKRKINVCVSMQGIKIKDEKATSLIFHHAVPKISFISQDITDARAFGYVFGSTDEPHQFIAIKTEKPAFHVVLALRDLFQTVLNHKQEEIEQAKEQTTAEATKDERSDSQSKNSLPTRSVSLVPSISELNVLLQNKVEKQEETSIKEDPKTKDENIYFELLLTEPLEMKETELVDTKEPEKTVDDLLVLQSQRNRLQEGIFQMDNSIAATAAYYSQGPNAENDPFDTSFVLGAKRNSITVPMPTPIPVVTSVASNEPQELNGLSAGDKYAAFGAVGDGPSVFGTSEPTDLVADEMRDLEEEIARKSAAPAKPPRISKSASPDLSLFADLDPLGKDRPYKDKTEFFQDVKNPPKKVLNDLFDPNKEASNVNVHSTSVPFPVDFESMSSPFPTPIQSQMSKSLLVLNGEIASPGHGPVNGNVSAFLAKSPSVTNLLTTQLSVNCNMTSANDAQLYAQTVSSSPIPIPPRHPGLLKDRSFSNGSISSPYSKSPQPYISDSPDQSSYFIQNDDYSEGDSPTGLKNQENTLAVSPNHYNKYSSNGHSQNGVSRPRPRASLSKGISTPNGGRTFSSHSLSSDSSSDYDVISRENMQSITNMLITNGHRLRAQSLCLESNNEFKLPNDKNIFTKKKDPFADEFFSVPKKASHHTKREIPDYV